MSRLVHLATLLGAILLTWSSADVGKLVTIERRLDPGRTWRTLAMVPGTFYLDTQPKPGQRYCYRARYSDTSRWAPTVCARSRLTTRGHE
jgi:hypothetical protein